MPQFSRFAPGTLPYMLDVGLWWTYRIAAVIFLFSVVGVTFIGRYRIGIWMVIISFIVWIGAWMGHRLFLQHWEG